MTFKKGDEVTLIRHWSNDTGASYIVDATVYSCGKVRMVLNTRDGATCLGRQFLPSTKQHQNGLCLPGTTKEEAEAKALEHSAAWISAEIAHCERCLAHYVDGGPSYQKSMNDKIAHLKTLSPSFVWSGK